MFTPDALIRVPVLQLFIEHHYICQYKHVPRELIHLYISKYRVAFLNISGVIYVMWV